MKKYLFIFLLAGVCSGQIIPDTLVMKSGKKHIGYYYTHDIKNVLFKYKKSTEKQNIKRSEIEEVLLSNGKRVFGSTQNFKSLDKLTTASSIKNGIGLGLGIGRGGISFSLAGLGIMSKDFQLFGALGGTIFNSRSEDNTYDFTDELFNDAKRGELVESVWFVGGTTIQINSKFTGFIGGGFTIERKYLKRYDNFEILGNDGIYFIEDDDYTKTLPTLHIGFSSPLRSNTMSLTHIGYYFNTNPLNITIIGWIGS